MEVAKPSKLDGCWHLCPHIKAETSHAVDGRNYFFSQEEIVLFLLLDISFIHTINDGILKPAFKREALFSKISFGLWLFKEKEKEKRKKQKLFKAHVKQRGGNPWFPWLHLVIIFTENYTQPIVSGCHGVGLFWFRPLFCFKRHRSSPTWGKDGRMETKSQWFYPPTVPTLLHHYHWSPV